MAISSSGMIPGPDGMYYAVNPATGQPERLVAIITPTAEGTTQDISYVLQSEAAGHPSAQVPGAQVTQGVPIGVNDNNWFDDMMETAIPAGLLAMGGVAAAGAAGFGPAAAGAGEAAVAGGAGETALLGGAGEDVLAAEGLADLEAGVGSSVADLAGAGAAGEAAGGAAVDGAMVDGAIAGGGASGVSGGAGPAAAGMVSIPGIGEVPISVLGTVAAGALGVYGADQMSDAYSDMAAREDARIREMMGYGAPYRTALSNLYANPSAFLESERVQVPVQMGTDALARSLSMTQGNPALSGTALHELQNYASNQLFSRYGEEADRLAGFGGLTQYAGGAARGPDLGPASNAINAQGGMLNVIGSGIADLTRPQPRTVNLRLV